MSRETFNSRPAVDLLSHAWLNGEALSRPLPSDARPTTLEEGYDIQDALIEKLGLAVGGWKLGASSARAMAAAGVDRPIFGRLPSTRLGRAGSTLRVVAGATLIVEFEIAMTLACDLTPATCTQDPGELFLSGYRAALELVGTRLAAEDQKYLPAIVADNTMNYAAIIGDKVTFESVASLASTIVIEVNGEIVARGLRGDDLADPGKAGGYLLSHVKDRRLSLRKGTTILTGSLSEPRVISARSRKAEVVAHYGDSELNLIIAFDK